MSYRRALALTFIVAVLLATPSFACPFECRTGVSEEGRGFAHCVEYLSGSCGNCNYATCDDRARCWHMLGAGTYCQIYCEGDQCYWV